MIYSCAVHRETFHGRGLQVEGEVRRGCAYCVAKVCNDRPVDYGARATTTHVDHLIALTGNHEWQPLYASDIDLLDGDRISRISQKHARGPACPG